MSEAEKEARRLVDEMYNSKHCGIEHFPNKNYCDCTEINYFQAKQCALIAVDEIIKALHKADTAYDLVHLIEYWQQVKSEIEKM